MRKTINSRCAYRVPQREELIAGAPIPLAGLHIANDGVHVYGAACTQRPCDDQMLAQAAQVTAPKSIFVKPGR